MSVKVGTPITLQAEVKLLHLTLGRARVTVNVDGPGQQLVKLNIDVANLLTLKLDAKMDVTVPEILPLPLRQV